MLKSIKNRITSVFFVWPVAQFLRGGAGREYGIGFRQKLKLYRQIRRNCAQPGCASSVLEQLSVVTQILQLPKGAEGAVAEFGCFKGFSTATWSLACALTKRRLLVFDSFQGLPAGAEGVRDMFGGTVPYVEGDFCGTLDEVRANVGRFGDLTVCEFVPGFFDQTLPGRSADERYALIFEDADLVSSVYSVLRYAWNKLQRGGYFFCHEARDFQVVRIFFDEAWWREELSTQPPGFVGSGCGIHSWAFECCLGYALRSKEE